MIQSLETEELVFIPLGGAGEIGMNLNLYGYGHKDNKDWIIVDLGVTFSKGDLPGVEVILPDPLFIEQHRKRLLGIVLTHAHEDHIGAVQYLWPKLKCPIFATSFTLSVLRRKLAETNFAEKVKIIEVPLAGNFNIGPFKMELITLTHSIPEPNAIAITTPAGTVMHTGDWKFDPDPIVGPVADEDTLRHFGDSGILAMVCDSTNVFSQGSSGSESDIYDNLSKLVTGYKGRVAVACFASNIARLQTIAAVAKENSRKVVLAGRSLRRITNAARENGYLAETPAFLDEEEAGSIPGDKVLIICTGSQGEPRAALARIANNDHSRIKLEAGDRVIFSSRIIPGNESAINQLQNNLIKLGIDVVTAEDILIHVSGHPARDEITQMYHYVRPQIAVPVHGEFKHLQEHAKIAKNCQVPYTQVIENGMVMRLAPGHPTIVDHVPSGRLVVDGNRIIPIDGEVLRSRTRTMWNGFAVITLIMKGIDLNGEIEISTTGLVEDDNDPSLCQVRLAVKKALSKLQSTQLRDDKFVSEEARVTARRTLHSTLGKRPVVRIHLVRID
ncbi:MAG: MBL fold hydrolase [Magnetovibrio sp.]|nr:MBL fold hydrolase [Magnetovibrio sp.]